MTRAKIRAAEEGISLKEFFISATEARLMPTEKKKVRKDPPVIITGAGPVRDATREEIEEAAFPIQHIVDVIERRRR